MTPADALVEGERVPARGINLDSEKIDQATWFRNWLAQVPNSEAGFATLWIMGSNTVQEKSTNALIATTMGVTLLPNDQGLNVNPNVAGVANFSFDTGTGQTTVDCNANLWSLNGGCPTVRNYDAIGANGAAEQTHRYKSPQGLFGGGALVMNRNDAATRRSCTPVRRSSTAPPSSTTSLQRVPAAIPRA